MTYPIVKIKGVTVVSDWMAPDLTFYPKSIRKYVEKYCPYVIGNPHRATNYFYYFEKLLDETNSRVNAVNLMMKELDWNLFFVVFSETDHVMHEDYQKIINGEKTVLKIFSKIDETIERAINLADLILIVSDHGFTKFNYLINVNTFLYDIGLAIKAQRLSKNKPNDTFEKEKGAIRHIQVPARLYKILSQKPLKFLLKNIFKFISGGKELRARLPSVDIKHSTAFYLSHSCGVWVKDQKLIDSLIRKIKSLEGIKSVWRREELFHGPYVGLAPHIIFSPIMIMVINNTIQVSIQAL